MGKTVTVTGYIDRLHHGFYASGTNCPGANVWVVLGDRKQPEALSVLMRSSVEPLDQAKDEIAFRAKIAMNDYRLPLSYHVSPRLSLEFFSREGEGQ